MGILHGCGGCGIEQRDALCRRVTARARWSDLIRVLRFDDHLVPFTHQAGAPYSDHFHGEGGSVR